MVRMSRILMAVAVMWGAVALYMAYRISLDSHRGKQQETPPMPAYPKINADPNERVVVAKEVDAGFNLAGTTYDPNYVMPSPAVIIIAYNRPDYLKRVIESLLSLPEFDKYVGYISQDGYDERVAAVAREYPRFHHWQRDRRPQLGAGQPGTAYLSQHYKHALDLAFFENEHSHVIVVEDDMEFSPDFLRFFEATAPLLEADPSLWCVSTWNDNGFKQFVDDPTALYRNGYFPGLGWMLRQQLWEELSPKFPLDHWDHWMRLSSTHKGRECVIPEVSRNYNFGAQGANIDAAKFDKFLRDIEYNKDPDVQLGDLSYVLQQNYEEKMHALVRGADVLIPDTADAVTTLNSLQSTGQTVVAITTKETFQSFSRRVGIWNEPRAQHKRTGIIKYKGNTLVIADARFSPYVPSEYVLRPSATLEATPASASSESCSKVCSAAGRVCDSGQFEFINDCGALNEAFPCENGCWSEVGAEIPAYVSDARHANHGKCLVTQAMPTCEASHRSTMRLCPCV